MGERPAISGFLGRGRLATLAEVEIGFMDGAAAWAPDHQRQPGRICTFSFRLTSDSHQEEEVP